jgi:large subunit ribosomal protein L41
MGIVDQSLGHITRGASRTVMTGKRGNKNYYKGKGSGRLGSWTSGNKYILEPWRLRDYIIPDLSTDLKPYMSPTINPLFKKSHSLRDWIENAEIDSTVKSRCLDIIQARSNRGKKFEDNMISQAETD